MLSLTQQRRIEQACPPRAADVQPPGLGGTLPRLWHLYSSSSGRTQPESHVPLWANLEEPGNRLKCPLRLQTIAVIELEICADSRH